MDPELPKERTLTDEIKGADLDEPLAVFLYVEGEKAYAMLIESFSKEEQELTFQWKTLEAK